MANGTFTPQPIIQSRADLGRRLLAQAGQGQRSTSGLSPFANLLQGLQGGLERGQATSAAQTNQALQAEATRNIGAALARGDLSGASSAAFASDVPGLFNVGANLAGQAATAKRTAETRQIRTQEAAAKRKLDERRIGLLEAEAKRKTDADRAFNAALGIPSTETPTPAVVPAVSGAGQSAVAPAATVQPAALLGDIENAAQAVQAQPAVQTQPAALAAAQAPKRSGILRGLTDQQVRDVQAAGSIGGAAGRKEAAKVARTFRASNVKLQKANERATSAGNIQIQDLDRVIKRVERNPALVGGPFAVMKSFIPGEPEHDLKELILSVTDRIGFAELEAMRLASPTGGAVGQLSDSERAAFGRLKGAITQSQSAGQFMFNAIRLRNFVLDTVHGEGNGPPRLPLPAEEQQPEPRMPAVQEARVSPAAINEENIRFTMQKYGVTREQVLERLGIR